MRTGRAALAAVAAAAGLWCAASPVSAAPAGPRAAGGWTAEQRWSPANDWEPNIAADPSSAWLYQMTTPVRRLRGVPSAHESLHRVPVVGGPGKHVAPGHRHEQAAVPAR